MVSGRSGFSTTAMPVASKKRPRNILERHIEGIGVKLIVRQRVEGCTIKDWIGIQQAAIDTNLHRQVYNQFSKDSKEQTHSLFFLRNHANTTFSVNIVKNLPSKPSLCRYASTPQPGVAGWKRALAHIYASIRF
jgi:hypothetical protein